MKVPFSLLPGESPQAQESILEGNLILTNYRFYVEAKQFNIPVAAIDSVDLRDIPSLLVTTKYGQSVLLTFPGGEEATLWQRRLLDASQPPKEVSSSFCFRFAELFHREEQYFQLQKLNTAEQAAVQDDRGFLMKEFRRMGFDDRHWRLCELNQEFRFSHTYPKYFIVPNEITDKELEFVASFRYSKRVPAVVWRSQKNGCVILRSSQPVVGWLGWRSKEDERLLQKVISVCSGDVSPPTEPEESSPPLESPTPDCHSDSPPPVPESLPETPLPTLNSDTNGHDLTSDELPATPTEESETEPEPETETEPEQETEQESEPEVQQQESNGHVANGQNGNAQNGNGQNGNGHIGNGSVLKSQEPSVICGDESRLLILDARSYTAALANRAVGGGAECAEYYNNCQVQFASLANIHTVRKSFNALRYLCEASQIDLQNWFTQLDNTKWLHYLSALLKCSMVIVDSINIQERPVLVHCSDGWDRTPQVVSLAELMLDPYYRTIEGFKVMVQREWCDFGHKFADRCGSSTLNFETNERSPVFLQWLDCVHQLVKQHPSEFEFNELFLVKFAQHVYSGLFGTFLCNNVQERINEQIYEKTVSFWAFVELDKEQFLSYLYMPSQEVLRASSRVKDLLFWNDVYIPGQNGPSSCSSDNIPSSELTTVCHKPKNQILQMINYHKRMIDRLKQQLQESET